MLEFRDAIKSEDRRTQLVALRDLIADKLDAGMCRTCGGPKGEAAGIAALSLRLLRVIDEIEAIPKEGEVSDAEALSRRRELRRISDTEDRASS